MTENDKKKHVTPEMKIKAINYYLENDISEQKLTNIIGVNVRTFRRWLSNYNSGISLKRQNRESVSYKIKQKHVAYSLKIIKKNQHISIKKLWLKLKAKYSDFNITEEHLGIVIRNNNITRKRTKIRHYPETRYGKPVDQKKQLSLFYSAVSKFRLTDVICIDETSITAQMKPNYSRCQLGKRCVAKTTDNRVFRKYTLVVAFSSKGLISYHLYEKGGMSGERMVDFLDKFINQIENKLIIMDNAGSHRNTIVKNKIKDSKNTLLYSVPYRPKTNACETFIGYLKELMKLDQKALSYAELQKNVKKSVKKIDKTHCKSFINYAYKKNSIKIHRNNNSTWKHKPKKYKK
jgi:transposase-like protein